jgi:hypothetical protein
MTVGSARPEDLDRYRAVERDIAEDVRAGGSALRGAMAAFLGGRTDAAFTHAVARDAGVADDLLVLADEGRELGTWVGRIAEGFRRADEGGVAGSAGSLAGIVGGLHAVPGLRTVSDDHLAAWAQPEKESIPVVGETAGSGSGGGAETGRPGGLVHGIAQIVSGAVRRSSIGRVLALTSRATGHTVGACAGGNVFGGYDVGGSLCYQSTPDGGSGFTASTGAGGAAPWGLSGLVGLSVSNARTSSDLAGTSGYLWGSGGMGHVGAGGSASRSRNAEGDTIWQATAGWAPGVRVPAPVSFGSGVSRTWTGGWSR